MTTDDIERQQRCHLHVEFALCELTANLTEFSGFLPTVNGGDVTRPRERVIRGALQILAARLMGRRSQEVAGDAEMLHGVRELETTFTQARQARGQRPHGR